jgi:hypothetical protein
MKSITIKGLLASMTLAAALLFTQCNQQSDMKELTIKKVPVAADAAWDEIKSALEASEWNSIDVINWPEYSYRPQVQFRLAYGDSAFFIQYRVKEKYIRARAAEDNGHVNLDACVEIFISPDGGDLYYSLESNCAGVVLFNVGEGRHNREFSAPELLTKIRRLPSLGREPFEESTGDFEWELLLTLPYECLFKHPGYTPEGKQAKANFFKCGDELTEEHYLTWNPIKAPQPDYHRPECFGTVKFE